MSVWNRHRRSSESGLSMTLLAETYPPPPPAGAPAPRVAVIVNCYNYEKYVELAIRSVLDQNCAACELVVVDDGSTDTSWDVICQTGAKAYRIENRGQPGACLFGVEATTAPFVLFLDADDELRPGALQTILAALDDGVAKAQFPLIWINEAGETLMTSPDLIDERDQGRTAEQVLRTTVYTTPPTSGNVFRRDVALLLREIESSEDGVDGAIVFVAPFMGDIVSIAVPLGVYRVHGRNNSGIGAKLNLETFVKQKRRHLSRIRTVRTILARRGIAERLVEPTTSFYIRELDFMMSVTRENKIHSDQLAKLLASLWRDYLPFKRKTALSAFYFAAALSRPAKAKQLLTYRLSPANRSPGGFLKLLFN